MAAREEELIVAAVREAVGDAPVILCGSRASGDAACDSDYDIVVVLGALRIPLMLHRLADVGRSLGSRLGTDVTVNPVPPLRLRHPGGNLFLWKLGRDGRVLAAARGLPPRSERAPEVTEFWAFSYLLSAVFYLIDGLDPRTLLEQPLRPHVRRAAQKALLHLVQLGLLRSGRYAARLDDAVAELADASLSALAHADSPESWFSIRDRLLSELQTTRLPERRFRAVVANLRYAVVSALRGRARWRAAATSRAVDERLAAAALCLLDGVERDGSVRPAAVAQAAAALPQALVPENARWEVVRDVVVAEWRNAHPLLAL